MNKNILITDNDIEAFQVETDKVLREYCLINIDNLKTRVSMLSKQVKKMETSDPAFKISNELLSKSESDLKLYLDELKYLDN